jgi:hypothetical protein
LGREVPRIQVVFYQEANGRAPVRQWLADLRCQGFKAHAKCVARIERLAELGHALMAVLVHALTKEGAVPEVDIRRALDRKQLLEAAPRRHLHEDQP